MSKYGVISGPYFPVFGLNTERYLYLSIYSPNTRKYGPEITTYLDTFYAVLFSEMHHFKKACFQLSSFKKNVSLEEVSKAIVLSVFIASFISGKRPGLSSRFFSTHWCRYIFPFIFVHMSHRGS